MTTFRTAMFLAAALGVNFSAQGQTPSEPKQELATSAKAKQTTSVKKTTPKSLPRDEFKIKEFQRLALSGIRTSLAFNLASPLFKTAGPVPCPATAASGDPDASTCQSDVVITELYDVDHKLVSCSVSSQEVNLTYGTPPRPSNVIWITWNLKPPTAQQAQDYTFELEKGVLILGNKNGATGGKGDIASKTQVKLKHTRKIKDDEIYYYPLVIQTLADGSKTLCAATDPRITND